MCQVISAQIGEASRSRSASEMGKTVVGVPPAAHTGSFRLSASSANTRTFVECPKGGVPPAAYPVDSRTSSREALREDWEPATSASLSVSSRRSPGTNARTGSSASSSTTTKTRLFTMADTGQPIAAAASSAVLVPSGKCRISRSKSGVAEASRRLASGSSAPADDVNCLSHGVGIVEVEPLNVDPLDTGLFEAGDCVCHPVGGAHREPVVHVAIL